MKLIRVKKDYPTIQAAVDAASPGDVIMVEKGIYNEEVMIKKDSISLIGEDDTALDGKFNLGTAFMLDNANNVRMESFRIINYKTDAIYVNNGSDNIITQNTIENNTFNAIELYQGNNIKIINNKIQGSLNYGIYSYSADKIQIEDNHISSNGAAGIYFYSWGGVGAIIRNNDVYLNYYYGIGSDGGYKEIVYNRIHNNRSYGIYVYNDSLIKSNMIYENGSTGVIVYGDNSEISENIVVDNAEYGIYIGNGSSPDKKVRANFIKGNSLNGMTVYGSFKAIENNVIKDNVKFDIVRLNANNHFINNTYGTSNPTVLKQNSI